MKENKASSSAYTVVDGILHTANSPKLSYLVDSETYRKKYLYSNYSRTHQGEYIVVTEVN